MDFALFKNHTQPTLSKELSIFETSDEAEI